MPTPMLPMLPMPDGWLSTQRTPSRSRTCTRTPCARASCLRRSRQPHSGDVVGRLPPGLLCKCCYASRQPSVGVVGWGGRSEQHRLTALTTHRRSFFYLILMKPPRRLLKRRATSSSATHVGTENVHRTQTHAHTRLEFTSAPAGERARAAPTDERTTQHDN